MSSKKSAKLAENATKNSQTEANNVAQNSGRKSQLLINFLVFVIALLLGILVQNYISINQNESSNSSQNSSPSLNIQDLYAELSVKLKADLLSELKSHLPPKEDVNLNKAKEKENRITIDENLNKETSDSAIRFAGGEPLVLNKEQIKLEEPKSQPQKLKPSREDLEKLRQERQASKKKVQLEQEKLAQNELEQMPEEIKNFKAKKISKIKTKKMWIPIPNSNGGHRRVPPIEVRTGKPHDSSVKIWLFEEFFSKEECEQLIQAHENHLKEMLKQRPIICFDSIHTLKKHLVDLKRENFVEKVSDSDFTSGTTCLNQTFSRQLEKWGLKWSFSTVFYSGESKFSKVFGKRIEEATMLNETHGGKFQITSYPFDVGYKAHTDCSLNSSDERDRYATFLVYLNELGAEGGGETVFPELGVDVKPREARALVWNNMNYESGKCEEKSIHRAEKVRHAVKKKYIIQRWYYLKNFYALGKRTPEPELPARPPNTAKVSCDQYDSGSCRMYDEWGLDHILEYRNARKEF